MISVLIPTFNYNIFPLVKEVYEMLIAEKIIFEIICLDDASTEQKINLENQKINKLKNSSFSELKENIGRSSIRNLLSRKAKFNWLLFLDADVFPKQKNFISQYLKHLNTDFEVVYGGIQYQEEKPPSNQVLRWKYGKEREALPAIERKEKPYLSFLTMNFLIKKEVFENVGFNEEIKQYGHEDTLFGYQIEQQNYQIKHIENPVFHLTLENNEEFFQKSLLAVKTAVFLEKENLIPSKHIKILQFYKEMQQRRLLPLLMFVANNFEERIKKNILGSNPSLKLFDFYRLFYLHKIKNA